MADTVLGNAIELLQDFGFFDVVLPFLLVFTIIFGILEKTRIFGTETVGGQPFPKKNINAMVAFTMAFFVVAAKEIVTSLQSAIPMISLLLVAVISLLMLVGSLSGGDKPFNFARKHKNWTIVFGVIFFVSVILIFFDSFGWLDPIWDYINGIGNEVFIGFVFLAITVAVMAFVFGAFENMGSRSTSSEDEEDEE